MGRLPYTVIKSHSSIQGIPLLIHILILFDFSRVEGFIKNSATTRIFVGLVHVIRSPSNYVA